MYSRRAKGYLELLGTARDGEHLRTERQHLLNGREAEALRAAGFGDADILAIVEVAGYYAYAEG